MTAKDETVEEKIISKVTSITQILLPFSAFSLAIRGATLNSGLEDYFEGGDDKSNRVVMKMLVVQPKSLQKCKAVFQLGTSAPLGAGTSFSTLNTKSEYEAANTLKSLNSSTNQHFNLPTPDAFVSPAKTTVAAVTRRLLHRQLPTKCWPCQALDGLPVTTQRPYLQSSAMETVASTCKVAAAVRVVKWKKFSAHDQ